MFKYETHLHTSPISRCARATVKENLDFYKSIGYDGVFITNHFIDGNMNREGCACYREKIEKYFSAVEEGKKYGEKIGLKVFAGVESSNKGDDFLIYGLSKEWFLSHPEIEELTRIEKFKLYRECGALLIQAHPFRDVGEMEIRLFPKFSHGVEVINAARAEAENRMAQHYADVYGFINFAGSDNHSAGRMRRVAGMCSQTPVGSEKEFVELVLSGKMKPFTMDNPF